MKPFITFLKKRLAITVFLVMISSMFSLVQAASPVSVKVYAQHVGARVIYYYRVINTGTEGISSVWIGHDNKNDRDYSNDVWELSELPVGWDFYAGIPASSATSPLGWRVYVINPEESEVHAVAWVVVDDNSPRIAPGQTLSGMTVSLDKADDRYRTGHAHVGFSSGQYPITVPLELDDTTPPILTVSVKPTRLQVSAGKLVTINATVAVKDDYDPAPAIKLESITANEPLAAGDIAGATLGTDDRQFQLRDVKIPKGATGRIYTITYSATDASGNKAVASATVSVK